MGYPRQCGGGQTLLPLEQLKGGCSPVGRARAIVVVRLGTTRVIAAGRDARVYAAERLQRRAIESCMLSTAPGL